jgi:uncharacterized protein (TIGR03437 family)
MGLRCRTWLGLFCIALFAANVHGETPQVPAPTMQNYARLPLGFEKQTGGSGERFVARGQGYVIGLELGKATIGVVKKDRTSHAVSLEFAGSKPGHAIPGAELPGKTNYIRGNDPRKWQLGLSSYERVTYPDTYPGIDVVYYGNQRQLEFDLVVKPGANPDAIRLKVEGADKLSIDRTGALNLGEAAGGLTVALPRIYQEVNGRKNSVPGRYTISGRDEVAFRVDPWDHTRPLVIDPTIVYSALLGGGMTTSAGQAIALDSSGNIFIAGYTYDGAFPTVNAAQNTLTGFSSSGSTNDAFVSKINAAGTALIYSTYLGGSNYDSAAGIAVDSTGAAWVAGYTESSDFPVLNAAQPTYGGGSEDAFLARFNSAGVLQFSTYLGGTSYDYGTGIAVDSSNNGYLTGSTYSTNFATTGGVVLTSNSGSVEAFVTKYSPGGAVVYSTLLGGGGSTYGQGIAVDSTGNAYVTGSTYDNTFTGAPGGGAQTTNNGNGDAYVAKLNSDATALLYFTFLGQADYDDATSIAVDASGSAYIAGQTNSTGLATGGAAQTTLAGVNDGFAAKLDPAGSAFSYVTYLGGNRTNFVEGLAVDGSGGLYLTGYTDSTNFPNVAALQSTQPVNGISLFNSTNSGVSFTGFDSNIPGGVVFQISVNPAGTSAVVLTEGGAYRTVNGGASWTQQFSGQFYTDTFLARSPAAPGTLYAVECCTTVLKSTDDGVSWTYGGNPTNNGIQGVLADPLTAGTVYLFGSGPPYVLKSTDGGSTFNSAAGGLPAGVQSMAATSDGRLYAGTSGFGIYTSTNQGGTWTAANTGLPATVYAEQNSLSASGTTVYFADGLVYETTDGGANWAATPGPYLGASQVVASPQNPSVLYLLSYDDMIYQSSDGGATWSSPATGLPSSLSDFDGAQLVADPSNSANAYLTVPVQITGFVAKLNSPGTALTYSTYLGGAYQNTQPAAIATDSAGNVFVTGYTNGGGFPITSTALPSGTNGIFITKISDTTAACPGVTVSPSSALVSQYGGTLTFSVVAPTGCGYNVSTDQPWAVVTSNALGVGVGTVTVQITPQSTTSSANLTVGTQTIPITLPSENCSYSLDMGGYSVAAAGGPVSAIMTAPAGCPWAVTNDYSSKISITSGASGAGNGTINLTVAPNPYSSPLNYYLPVGSTQIDLTQTAAAVSVGTMTIPSAAVGAYYATTLAATGGTPPYGNWTPASGSLPPGLTLNAATGVISGIPATQVGTPFDFSITVQDSLSLTSSAQSLTLAIGPFATYPGQDEDITSPRSTSAQPLLIPYVTNQSGLDTRITIANTTEYPFGGSAQGGTCTISYYGAGAPLPNAGLGIPGGALAAGATTNFLLSSFAPGFEGYVVVDCPFPLARGTAEIIYNPGQPSGVSISENAQVLTLPRNVPATQNFLLPYVTNQNGYDTGIVIANTSTDPFGGGTGATPTAGSCTLNFYGAGAPVPNTGVAIPGGTLASGTSAVFHLSSVAPGFQGYVIAQCDFGAAASFAYNFHNLTQNGGYAFSETPEAIALPRPSSGQPLLFPFVTNQNGNDTQIEIANTTADPFGASGASPISSACVLNFYGANAPASPFITPFLSPGTVYSAALSAIAPGFQGYITTSCAFGTARGYSYVIGGVGANDYSETAEVVPIPRNAATPSTVLFSSTTNVAGYDTSITIANTSQDSYGTTAASGACALAFYGATNPAPTTTPTINAGSSYSFLLSGVAPGFSGYVIATCSFPLARGTAETMSPPEGPSISTTSLPGGTVGIAYSQPLAATGGVGPYHNWIVVSGSLPPGLTLDPATGVIGPSPTSATGSPFHFSVTVQDSQNNTSAARSLSIAVAPAAAPVISGIINGFDNTLPPLAPGSLASLYGTNLAFTSAMASSVPLPFTLDGVSVSVNGNAAALAFVSAGQINFQIPYETAVGNATVIVTNSGSASAGFQFSVALAAPGISLIENTNTSLNTAANPIAPGGVATVYLTGLGATSPAVGDGAAAPSSPPFATPVAASSVTVAGLTATVTFIGLAPGEVGLAQANVVVPAVLLAGSYPLIVSVNGSPSAAATIYVSGPAPSVTAVTPHTVPARSPATQITISGTNFGGGSTVSFAPPAGSPTAIVPSSIQAAQIVATIPAAQLTSAGTAEVAVSNGLGVLSAQLPFTITAPLAPSISFSTGSVSTTTGGSVSAGFSVSGGTAPYSFSLSGQPSGVVLGSGSLGGSPTQAGVFTATVTVTDANSNVASASITINVLGLTTTALPNGTTGQPYAVSLGAAGGTGSYSFSATGLPSGLSLTSYGYLAGTVKTAGTYPLSVTVSSGGLSAIGTLGLTIAQPQALSISQVSGFVTGASGTVDVAYSQTLAATGGVPPYTWSMLSGTLPPGLTLNAAGIVSGTPTDPGSFSFVVQVGDTAGAAATSAVRIAIQPAPLILTTQSLPAGMNSVDYPQQQLTVTGGVPPYIWALGIGSSLPTGMSLSTSGVLSGVPTVTGSSSVGVTVTDHAMTHGSEELSLTIRPLSGDLILTSSALAFSLLTPAVAAPPSQSVGVQSTVASTTISYSVSVSPAAPWLAVANGSTTPDSIQVSIAPAAFTLSPGPYRTTITATCTSSSCNGHTQTVAVNLTVTGASPSLQISTGLLSFATTSASSTSLSQPINIQNAGGGSLGFASLSCEAPWCTVGPSPQSLGGGASAAVPVTVNPSLLSPGFYRTQVDITTSAGQGSAPITLFIAANATMTLAPAGEQFSQPAGSSPGNPNGSFLVSVNSSTPVNFSAAVLPGASWLLVGTPAGASTSTQPGTVSYSIDKAVAGTLAVGAYYGEIAITSPDASNSPQDFEVVLNVTPAVTPVAPDPQPGGLLFITTVGGVLPPQTVTVYSGSVEPLTFQASAATTDGGGWLSVTPVTGSASLNSPGVTTVSVDTSKLSAGVYQGGVSYSLSATAVRTVNVTLIVSSAGAAASAVTSTAQPKASGCTPSRLVAAQTGLVQSFFAPAGWPTPLAVLLFDDCGAEVNNGQIVATFSNGDPPLALALVNSSQGLYSGTWSPANPSSQVTIDVTASAPGFAAVTNPLSGAVVPNAVPLLTPNGTLHSFNPLIGGALAPGTIVEIFGQNLASATVTSNTVPLPTTVSGSSVIIGGMEAPLYYVSPGQIDAQVPFELQSGQQYQVIVLVNGALTTPQGIELSPATPGLATEPDGTLIAQHSDGTLVSQTAPAMGGEYLVAYLAGLGDTTVPVTSGSASPSSPLASPSSTLVLTINGAQSPIYFAGLTPGLVGLYQMNFQVPADLPAGNITVVVSQNGYASNQTVLPYQP